MKVFLIIVGCILAFLLAAGGAGYYLWRQHGDELIRITKEAIDAGTAYGKANSDSDCFDRSLELMQGCTGFQCSLYNRAFAGACYKHVAAEDGLCDRVPEKPGFTETLRWVTEQCGQAAPHNSQCSGVMQEAIKYCTRAR